MSALRVLVAGGGASGLFAAITAARNGAAVTLIEKTGAPGKKLSMTGNGRCNLSNLSLEPEAYNRTARGRMLRWLSACTEEALSAYFASLGLLTRAEGSFVYPVSGQAASVVTVLTAALKRCGVTVITGAQLKKITPLEHGFACTAGGVCYEADAVILATGGLSGPSSCRASGDAYYLCEHLGMEVTPLYPALVPLLLRDDTLPIRTGVRAWGRVSFYAGRRLVTSEFGEIQFTARALSGIPVLQASHLVAEELDRGETIEARVDFLPELSGEDRAGEWERICARLFSKEHEREEVLQILRGICNEEIARSILRRVKLEETARLSAVSASRREMLCEQLRAFPVRIEGVGDYEHAQATAGGVALSEIDEDCQSIRHPGLYLTGELLDVNGRCGGYNLHWAFMSGILAGTHAATGSSFRFTGIVRADR